MRRWIEAAKREIAAQKAPFSLDEIREAVEELFEEECEPISWRTVVWQTARDELRREGVTLTCHRGRYFFGDHKTANAQGRRFARKGFRSFVRASASYDNALTGATPFEVDSIKREQAATDKILGAVTALHNKSTKKEPTLGSKGEQ